MEWPRNITRIPTRKPMPKTSLQRLRRLTRCFPILRREKASTDSALPHLTKTVDSTRVPVQTRFPVQGVSVDLEAASVEVLVAVSRVVDFQAISISRICLVPSQAVHAALDGADGAPSRKSLWVKTSRFRPACPSWRPRRGHREILSSLPWLNAVPARVMG